MLFTVAATSRQIFIVKLFVVCRRYFFYHEALSSVALNHIKAFGPCLSDDRVPISNSIWDDAESIIVADGFRDFLDFLRFHSCFRRFLFYIDEQSTLLVAPIRYFVEPVIQLRGGHDSQKAFQHVTVIFGASKVPVPSKAQQEDTQDIQFADKN